MIEVETTEGLEALALKALEKEYLEEEDKSGLPQLMLLLKSGRDYRSEVLAASVFFRQAHKDDPQAAESLVNALINELHVPEGTGFRRNSKIFILQALGEILGTLASDRSGSPAEDVNLWKFQSEIKQNLFKVLQEECGFAVENAVVQALKSAPLNGKDILALCRGLAGCDNSALADSFMRTIKPRLKSAVKRNSNLPLLLIRGGPKSLGSLLVGLANPDASGACRELLALISSECQDSLTVVRQILAERNSSVARYLIEVLATLPK